MRADIAFVVPSFTLLQLVDAGYVGQLRRCALNNISQPDVVLISTEAPTKADLAGDGFPRGQDDGAGAAARGRLGNSQLFKNDAGVRGDLARGPGWGWTEKHTCAPRNSLTQ